MFDIPNHSTRFKLVIIYFKSMNVILQNCYRFNFYFRNWFVHPKGIYL